LLSPEVPAAVKDEAKLSDLTKQNFESMKIELFAGQVEYARWA
jgi:hypothetical protein